MTSGDRIKSNSVPEFAQLKSQYNAAKLSSSSSSPQPFLATATQVGLHAKERPISDDGSPESLKQSQQHKIEAWCMSYGGGSSSEMTSQHGQKRSPSQSAYVAPARGTRVRRSIKCHVDLQPEIDFQLTVAKRRTSIQHPKTKFHCRPLGGKRATFQVSNHALALAFQAFLVA